MQEDNTQEQRKKIIEEKLSELKDENEEKLKESVQPIIEFNKIPKDLKQYLDRYVIGQEEGKKVLSTAIAFHYKRLGKGIKDMAFEPQTAITSSMNSIASSGTQSGERLFLNARCGR